MDNGQRHPRDVSTKEPAATKTPGGPILPRVLFACDGWPSGIIDLASWIDRRGLAETIVVQFQPGRLFRLEPELGETIQSGFADDRLREAFRRRGFPLNEGAYLSATGPGEWKVQDRALGTDFQIAVNGEGYDVLSSPPPPALPRKAFLDLGEAFVRKLQSFQPHVVGFRVEGADIEVIRRRVEAVRRVVDTEIVLGGPTATSHPRHTLEATGADYVFAHETEESFALFLDWARRDNAFRHAVSVPGLTYAYAGTVYVNEPPRDGYGVPLRASNSLPRPAPSVQILRENRLNWGLLENFNTESDGLYFTGGRGCPGECTFCAQMHGRRVRSKTADQLLEEITGADRLVRRGTLQVSRWPLFEHTNRPDLQPLEVAWASIYDEDFFLDRRRAVEFFRLWDATDLKTRYRLGFQTNPRSLLNFRRPVRSGASGMDRPPVTHDPTGGGVVPLRNAPSLAEAAHDSSVGDGPRRARHDRAGLRRVHSVDRLRDDGRGTARLSVAAGQSRLETSENADRKQPLHDSPLRERRPPAVGIPIRFHYAADGNATRWDHW